MRRWSITPESPRQIQLKLALNMNRMWVDEDFSFSFFLFLPPPLPSSSSSLSYFSASLNRWIIRPTFAILTFGQQLKVRTCHYEDEKRKQAGWIESLFEFSSSSNSLNQSCYLHVTSCHLVKSSVAIWLEHYFSTIDLGKHLLRSLAYHNISAGFCARRIDVSSVLNPP